MRLKQYLTEDVKDMSEIVDMLTKDCKPFLKELSRKDYNHFIFRGSRNAYGTIKKIKSRKDRLPKDTPIELHKVLDKYFKEEFGWKVRSEGVFAAPWRFVGHGRYGRTYLFFPIGNFDFVWSMNISDLYEHLEGEYISDNCNVVQYYGEYGCSDYFMEEEDAKEAAERVVEEVVSYNYTDRNFQKALASSSEIAFRCKSYYMVDVDEEKLGEELKERT